MQFHQYFPLFPTNFLSANLSHNVTPTYVLDFFYDVFVFSCFLITVFSIGPVELLVLVTRLYVIILS